MDPIAIKLLMVILVTITIGTMLEKEKEIKGFSWFAIFLLTCCFLFEASTAATAA